MLYNTMLAIGFEWGVGLQHLELGKIFKGRDDRKASLVRVKEFGVKAGHQVAKDYVAYPALTSLSPGATFRSTLTANAVANVIRNVWANAVIFCGHFPDGAEKFTKTDMVGETKGQWYLRQMLGSANFENGPGAALHERQPVPPDRAPPVSGSAEQPAITRSRSGCGSSATSTTCPYTTGNFLVQYGKTWRTIAKLSLPDNYLRDTARRRTRDPQRADVRRARAGAAAWAEVGHRRGA